MHKNMIKIQKERLESLDILRGLDLFILVGFQSVFIYKEQWYLEKRNAICMTCGCVSPLSTQSTFEDLAVDLSLIHI